MCVFLLFVLSQHSGQALADDAREDGGDRVPEQAPLLRVGAAQAEVAVEALQQEAVLVRQPMDAAVAQVV